MGRDRPGAQPPPAPPGPARLLALLGNSGQVGVCTGVCTTGVPAALANLPSACFSDTWSNTNRTSGSEAPPQPDSSMAPLRTSCHPGNGEEDRRVVPSCCHCFLVLHSQCFLVRATHCGVRAFGRTVAQVRRHSFYNMEKWISAQGKQLEQRLSLHLYFVLFAVGLYIRDENLYHLCLPLGEIGASPSLPGGTRLNNEMIGLWGFFPPFCWFSVIGETWSGDLLFVIR